MSALSATIWNRRGDGKMAAILKRMNPSGKVIYRVQFKDQHGKRHEITAGPLKRHAEALLSTILDQVNAGTYGESKEETSFSEFCKIFLSAKKAEVKPSTYVEYEQTINKHLLPFFQDSKLVDIGPSTIQELIFVLESKGTSPATIGKILRYTRVILRKAVNLELIDRDPCRTIKAPRIEKKEVRFLTPEEVSKLIESAQGDLRPLLAVACYTGLRMGEILALQWSDIDFKANAIRVIRSWKEEQGFTAPKTATSRRMVPLIKPLKRLLLEYHASREEPGEDRLVFPNSEGKPRDRHRLSNIHFKNALKAAELPAIRFHDLRHTFASMMIESGCDTKTLQTIMGHSSVKVTLDVYSHLYRSSYDRAAKNLETLLAGGDKVVHIHKGSRSEDTRLKDSV
jgi:integrase